MRMERKRSAAGIILPGRSWRKREVAMKGASNNQQFYSVYLPTNNLYLGQVALFKAEEVIITAFTIKEGLKIILSGGTACPPRIPKQDLQSIS
jgi:uncharacterized membrane protein